MLLLEITLTKILSVTLWYHFSFFVVSLAMFGIGFGGLLVYFLQDKFKTGIKENLSLLSLSMAISIVLNLQAAIHFHFPNTFNFLSSFQSLGFILISTMPFMLGSMVLSILF